MIKGVHTMFFFFAGRRTLGIYLKSLKVLLQR